MSIDTKNLDLIHTKLNVESIVTDRFPARPKLVHVNLIDGS